MENGFKCSCCGEFHEGLPLDYGAKAPVYYFDIPPEDREKRAYLNDDVCVVDNEFFFVRGCLEIPILKSDELFVWGVWCSLSKKNYERMLTLWDDESIADEPPYFGWLNTILPYKPTTLSLKTNVHLRANNQRPFIELQPTKHPLSVEQTKGITMQKIQEIAERIMHDN